MQHYFKKQIFISYRPPPYTGCSLAPTGTLSIAQFLSVLQTSRQRFQGESVQTGKLRLLLTMCVAVAESIISDIPEISTYV